MRKSFFSILFLLFCLSTLLFSGCKPIRPVRIACVGDNYTVGDGVYNKKVNSYPAKLQAIGGKDYIVENFGTSGATVIETGSSPYIESLSYTQALNFEPDIIILALGWNDIEAENLTMLNKHFVEDYNHLIKTFSDLPSRPDIVLLLMPVYTTEPSYKTDHNKTGYRAYLTLMEKVAKENKIPLLDLFFSPGKEIFEGDTVQLTVERYETVAEMIYELRMELFTD